MSRPIGPGPLPSPPIITPASRCSLGGGLARLGLTQPASGTSPWSDAASGLLAFPFVLEAPTRINKFFWINGSAAGGNTDMCVYEGETFTKVGTATGSVAGSGNSIPQVAAPASGGFNLPPGLYYCAITHSATTTNQMNRWTIATLGIGFWMGLGYWKMASQAVGSTPATATPGDITNVAFPYCGIITRTAFDV